MVDITYPNGRTKRVHFGANGYSDYTIHKDVDRKDRYLARHRPREQWTKKGLDTAGFWARWILWNCPSLPKSIKYTADKFNLKIVRKR